MKTHHFQNTRASTVLACAALLAGCVSNGPSRVDQRICVQICQIHMSKARKEPCFDRTISVVPADLCIENCGDFAVSLQRDFMELEVAGKMFRDKESQVTWTIPMWQPIGASAEIPPFDLIVDPHARTNLTVDILVGTAELQVVNQHLIPSERRPKAPRILKIEASQFDTLCLVRGKSQWLPVFFVRETSFE